MVYKVKTEGAILKKVLFLYVLSLPIISNFLSKDIIYIYLGILGILIILASRIQFELTIGDGYLFDERVLFGKSLYKKRIDPKRIKKIKFILVGWKGKGAIIQIKKGFNISITHYTPDSVITDLMDFAQKYGIPIEKTKDFKVLEKWKM